MLCAQRFEEHVILPPRIVFRPVEKEAEIGGDSVTVTADLGKLRFALVKELRLPGLRAIRFENAHVMTIRFRIADHRLHLDAGAWLEHRDIPANSVRVMRPAAPQNHIRVEIAHDHAA